MFTVGAYLLNGERAIALAITGSVLLLLYAKQPLHNFVRKLGKSDVTAIVQFVIITLIILPILPNQTYGPYAVLNPFEIWLMVVLIVGLNLFGFIAYKFLSTRTGTTLSGVFGGLVSSTATTVSYARQYSSGSINAPLAALIIIISSTIMFVRVLIEIFIIANTYWFDLASPILMLLFLNIILSLLAYSRINYNTSKTPKLDNPAELKPALIFGAVYAIIIFIVAAAKEMFGDPALYLVGFLSGMTDIDAITLSTAQLVQTTRIDPDTGWQIVICALVANLAFKTLLAGIIGGTALLRLLIVFFSLNVIFSIMILWQWPLLK